MLVQIFFGDRVLRLAALLPLLVVCTVALAAEGDSRSPQPVFHCEDWRRDSAGRLASVGPVTAGLIEIGANTYLGDHTIIDGIDYTEALHAQCGRP